jgi:Ribbon-helix-helix protein, copG family
MLLRSSLTQALTTTYDVSMAKKPEETRGTSSVSVRLPDDLIAWIDEQAQEERRSRGSFIKNALEDLRTAVGKK